MVSPDLTPGFCARVTSSFVTKSTVVVQNLMIQNSIFLLLDRINIPSESVWEHVLLSEGE